MSSKRKYYEITTVQWVSAKSKTDAIAKVQRRPHIDADILGTEIEGHRIPATEAHTKTQTA